MQTDFNDSFTAVFESELQKGLKLTTLPQICCHTILQNFSIHVSHNDISFVLGQ